MESGSDSSEPSTTISQSSSTPQELRRQRQILIGIIAAIVILVVLIVFAIIYLLQPATPTDRIRDIFIIFMALESLVLGLVLVILIVQLARLINLLQNEIKPILDSTNETVSTLRGTTEFLGNNLVEPVIKMNEYSAGIQQALKMVGLFRGKKN
jgi:predicted tellurium resistance membrane protein TerC